MRDRLYEGSGKADRSVTTMILLTGFKPFAGRGKNGSETLARSLSGCLVGGIPVNAEVLDVLWGEPERKLSMWISEFRPRLLLGLGEGKGEALRFETRGVNRASGWDEAGCAPPEILAGEPVARSSTMRFDAAWVADLVPTKMSCDAGEFLCNAWLYTALGLDACPAAFVHLPIQGETADEDYCARWSPAISELLERNLAV